MNKNKEVVETNNTDNLTEEQKDMLHRTKEEYIVEYTKVRVLSPVLNKNNNNVRKKIYYQSLDDVFEILRFSKSCKEKLGLKFDGLTYSDGTICSEKSNIEEMWIHQDISIRPMTDEDKEE